MKRFLASYNRVVVGVVLLSASLLMGCAHAPRSAPLFGAMRGSGIVTVTVRNDDFKDAVIYATWRGFNRKRVGLAIGKTSQTFTIEWQPVLLLQFDADFIAGGTVPFGDMPVNEGDHLDLIIRNQG